MSNINLNTLRDRAYKTACEHGFHDEELSNEHCFCLVISELMEAVEADRKGQQFNKDAKETYELIQNVKFCKIIYDNYIKGSIEEELADAAIRLLDLAGYRDITIEEFTEDILYEAAESCDGESFTESIYAISTIPIRCEYEYDYQLEGQLNGMLLAIFGLAKHLDIDLLWHIEQKMKYNELCPKMHGKKS